MNKSALTLIALVLLAAAAVNANAAVTVMDAPSCSEWNPKQATHRIWIEGFLSGIAMERQENFLEKTSLDSILKWVNDYCKANPRGEVTVAGIELSLELVKRQQSARH
ncbi:MAG: hypothetical protein KJ899_00645 [Gammaproteobacteria bacterium]|nr:hypothetical protein [Gammaproteobacteria bacterium]